MGDERKTKSISDLPTVVSGPAAVRFEVPRRVGSVVLERMLGAGGMGEVWLGRHEMLGRDVAVKFLTEAVEAGDPGFVTFVEGARAAAAVKHAGLVEVFDAGVVEVGQEGGAPTQSKSEDRLTRWHVPYLVMEVVDGPGLDAVLRAGGALSLGAALALMEQVCSAIGELHAAGFVHRDIKPGNVLLDGDGRLHVTDFGLACERPRVGAGGAKVAVSGTPAYMAPEVFAGEISARGDVYALAVMLYELLTGSPPFSGELLTVKRAHEAEAAARGPLEAKGVPPAVVEVIERGMVKAVMLRPRSAAHFLEGLRAAVRDSEVWEAGARELKGLAARARGAAEEGRATGDSTSYYKTIAERAQGKRKLDTPVVLPEDVPAPDSATCSCGYALKGLTVSGVCPECGKRIAESVKSVPLPCVSCGYDLVGIDERDKCPECGRAVKESVWPSRLLFADEAWLKRVAMGMNFIAWGLWLMPLTILAIGAFSMAVMGRSAAASFGIAIGLATAAGMITSLVLFVIGVVNATWPEPGPHGGGAARWVRLLWLVGMGLLVAGVVAEQVEKKFPEQFFLLPATHLMLVGVVLFGAMLARLGERIPDRKLLRSARSVFWPWVGVLVVYLGIVVSKSRWFASGMRVNESQFLGIAWFVGMIYAAILAGVARPRLLAVARMTRARSGEPVKEDTPRPPVWRGVAWAVLTFCVLVVPLFLLAPKMRLGTYVIMEWLGLLMMPPGTPVYTVVEGREFQGRPPAWLDAAGATAMVAVIYIVPVIVGFVVYLAMALSRPRRDGVTRCGWCGYALQGIKEARCPECGVEVGGKPAEGNPHVWMRKRWRRAAVLRVAGAGAVFPVLLGLLVVGAINPIGIPEPGPDVKGVVTIVLTHAPPFLVALLVFHFLVRGIAGLRGRTSCGACGAEIKGLKDGGCAACGARVVG